VLFACRGECPKNRVPSGGVNYLCDGYRNFFRHTSFTMRLMAGLIRRGRNAEEVMMMLAPSAGWDRAPRDDHFGRFGPPSQTFMP
jgi:uncharacterized protein